MASARFPDPTLRDYRAGWRMREVSRLEGLSDAVFGFALTLLVVSLEVPRTSADLLERTFVGVVPLALTFSFLFATWYAQHRFFRIYGLEDTKTTLLTGLLLFMVVFYVYPLQFVANWMWTSIAGLKVYTLERAHRPILWSAYGLGLAGLMLVIAALYDHAYRKRAELGLTELEVLETRRTAIQYLLGAVVGFLIAAKYLWPQSARGGGIGSVPTLIAVALVSVAFWRTSRAFERRKRDLLSSDEPRPHPTSDPAPVDPTSQSESAQKPPGEPGPGR